MQNSTRQQVYGGFFVRLAAFLIDWIILGAALLLVKIPLWLFGLGSAGKYVYEDFIFSYSVYDILIYILKLLYFVLLTYYTGATLGKKLLHLKVVSTEGRKLTFFEILFRESVGKFLASVILYIGYIMIGADKEKRGLHDILSDTRVVYAHEQKVPVPTPIVYQTVSQPVPVQQYSNQMSNHSMQKMSMPMENSAYSVNSQNPQNNHGDADGIEENRTK